MSFENELSRELLARPAFTGFKTTYADDTSDIDGAKVDVIDDGNQRHLGFAVIHAENGNSGDELTFTIQTKSDTGSWEDLEDSKGNKVQGTLEDVTSQKHLVIPFSTNLPLKDDVRVKLHNADATLGGSDIDLSGEIILGDIDFLPAS